MQDAPAGPPTRSTDSGRYRVLTPLGQGGMGVVYLARDTVLGQDVALKTLRTHSPDEVYQLKKEFRSLADLSHPNLVQLYDLVVLNDECFFTMELIDGVDLVQYLRRGIAGAPDDPAHVGLDYRQVRETFRQLAVGLHALHAHGKVHRDVKPANILVEPTGRVVLLDFGLASALASDASQHSRVNTLAGTLAYMAPEQVAGLDVSAASDWYSVGLVLYETLTGQPPFVGPAVVSAFERTHRVPPTPREVVPETPADLDRLNMDLLSIAPDERPTGARLLERLSSPRRQAPPHPLLAVPADETRFVGRAGELTLLHAAFAATRTQGLSTVCLSGTSGIGKTALVEHLLSDLSGHPEPLVLRSRCHPQESIPFKAVDGAIDDLTRFLAHQPEADLEPFLAPDLAALGRIFPVLGRVNALAELLAAEDGGREPQEIRRRAFRALRELLSRIAERHPVVLWIDDFQWSDLDSAALLHALRVPPDAPRMLILLSLRSGAVPTASIASLFDADDAGGESPRAPQHMELAPLPEHETRELARQIIVGEGRAASERAVMSIARESAGSPFFACELARHLAGRGVVPGSDSDVAPRAANLMAQRVAELPAYDRRLLELVSVAGEPIQEELVYKVAGGREDTARVLGRLRAERLLRHAVTDDQLALDTYHDRVRETVVGLLSTDAYRSLHRELAAALEALPHPDPQRLVEHYFRANDLARAGAHAVASAERASAALAFDQAARLYHRALQLQAADRPLWILHAKLAVTLASMGRGAEAATSFVDAAGALAAHEPDHPEVSRLKRQAAEHYMRSGRHDEGLRVLREVLAHAGLGYATSPNRAIASLIVNRSRLWLRHALPWHRRAAALDARALERLEVCWSAGLGLGVSDSLRAADFQVRHALMAQRAGDVGHQARALATEALLMVWEGGERKRRRAGRLRVESERLARASREPNIEAYSMVLRTVGAFFERRLREAVVLADRAEALCRDKCVAVSWELANVQTIAVTARICLGDLANIGRRVHRTLREARERGDQYCLLMIRLGYCNLAWLAADEPDEAQRQARAALAQPFPATFTWPIYQGALAQAHIDLYRGDVAAGHQRMHTAWSALRTGGMLRLQPVRIEMRELRARCAVRAASVPGCAPRERQRLLGFARREIRRLAAEDVAWVAPFADALRGGIAASTGDTATAVDLLENAAQEFDHLDMGLNAAALRFQLAALLPAAEAPQRRAEQAAWMRDHGVRNPDRMAAVFAPWTAAA
ncbi:MAG: protein kinase [bacterium]